MYDAPFGLGDATLYRDRSLVPTVNRPAPTGPLPFTDMRTGTCDSRCIQEAYQAADQRCGYLLRENRGNRLGEYLTCANAYVSSGLNACGCAKSKAVQAIDVNGAAPSPEGPLVQAACFDPRHVMPSEAAAEACVAQYQGRARDGVQTDARMLGMQTADAWKPPYTGQAFFGVQPAWVPQGVVQPDPPPPVWWPAQVPRWAPQYFF
jgi:hypothetical protein